MAEADAGDGACPVPGRLLAVSPHLDDAVFSCGDLLARAGQACVLTVFAGDAPQGELSTDWDRRCGFSSAAQAMAARREENRQALAALGAHEITLPWPDSQYRHEAPAGLREALRCALRSWRPDAVLVPLGLFHEDHWRASDALLRIGAEGMLAPGRWWAYEEALYRRKPGLVQQRLAALLARGVAVTPAPHLSCPAHPSKRAAVAAYASQLAALGLGPGQGGDTMLPERYWRLDWLHAA
ncbi:PIG-L family deacetylase [Orrella sp. JC864]|uniref:PIG-L family deacetylase n=1 Tax=Orrella sp. JC864 TaxID=3120298 RepID=UPI00300B97F5